MNPTLLQKASFIYNSNKIENVGYPLHATHEILKDWLQEEDAYEKSLMQKHFKYEIAHFQALEYVLTRNTADGPPTWVDCLKIHDLLMQGQLPDQQRGALRDCQVYIGCHTPPAPGAPLLAALEKFIRSLDHLDKIVLAENEKYRLIYNSHCRFETLHPFRDGNGRGGRLFWLMQLRHYGFEFNEISVDDQQEYYGSLQESKNVMMWYPPRVYLEK